MNTICRYSVFGNQSFGRSLQPVGADRTAADRTVPFAARVVNPNRLLAILTVVAAATQRRSPAQIDPGQDVASAGRKFGCGRPNGPLQDPID